MKKLILSFSVMMICFTASAQEPEKKKESQTPTKGQERGSGQKVGEDKIKS